MRILEVASGMPDWAGTEKHIMDLVPCLLERGHDVVIGCRAVSEIGRLATERGFDILVRAIGLTRQSGVPVHCAIAGRGDEMERLMELRTELGLTDVVHLIGFRNDVPALFAAADAVVVPSTAESFGYVPVEAMASGRPVIGSRVGGIPEVITPDVGFLIQAGDAKGIADAIEDLALHPDKKNAMGRSGPSRAAQFSLGAMVSNVEAVFIELLGSRSKSRNRLVQSEGPG